jgi:hypothetical protein
MGHEVEGIEGIRDDEVAARTDEVSPAPAPIEIELVSAEVSPPVMPIRVDEARLDSAPIEMVSAEPDDRYRVSDLAPFPADPSRFFDFAYRDVLRAMVITVIETESPLRTDILYQRVARAHGWLRTGGKIRERIEMHLRDFDRTHESSGEFVWKGGAVADFRPYRAPDSDEARRAIPEIPLAELAEVVRVNPDLLDEPDPARELARTLGVERLAAGSRARLDEAIARARGDNTTLSVTPVMPGAV